jgi:hypothetical protein
MEVNPQKLYITASDFIAYHKHEGKKNNASIIFLCGFMSDMEGIKALALEKFCQQRDCNFIRFDYFGHGKSSRKFTDCTIGAWKQNILDVIDKLTAGKQILIGSSMGGWLMLLAAMERPARIAGLIGIASAPDFTENLIWGQMTHYQQKQLLENGIYHLKSEFSDNPYPVTKQLIEEGREHLLLSDETLNNAVKSGILNYKFPIRLIHGLKDRDVPSSISLRIAKMLDGHDVSVNLVENGDHRMSTPDNIKLMLDTLDEML